MLEVNESLLTGESDAVVKEAGSELYSGSSVISGKAYAKVTHVGNENYATKLANEVKKEKRVASELLGSMNKVTRFTSMLIVPLGVILFFEAFLLRQAPMPKSPAPISMTVSTVSFPFVIVPVLSRHRVSTCASVSSE